MKPWIAAYVALAIVWLAFTLYDMLQCMFDGRVLLPPGATAAKRIFVVVHLFWTYLCGAVLWPGSAFLYVVAKIIGRYDQEDE